MQWKGSTCGRPPVATCTTMAIEGEQTILGPANRLNRSQWYVTALIIGAVFFGLWNATGIGDVVKRQHEYRAFQLEMRIVP